MSNLAGQSILFNTENYRITIERSSFNLDQIINSRKIKISSLEFANTSFFIGQYIHKVVIYHNQNELCAYGGIVSSIKSENEIEIGLFTDLPDSLLVEESLLEKVKPFKVNFKSDESRKSNRVSIRYEDAISLKIEINGFNLDVKLFDLSSFGFSFISKSKISKDVLINFEINLRDGLFKGTGSVTWVHESGQYFKTGLKFISFDHVEKIKKTNQIVIKENYSIHGVYSKVNFYFEKSAFKVLSLSNESFILQIDKSDQYVLPGMKLDLKFFLSTLDYKEIPSTTVTICYVQQGPNGSLIAGCNVQKLDQNLSLNLSNYLLQFLDVSPNEARDAGFNVSKIADVFSFKYVETHADYVDVLKLRFEAYLNAGKVDKSKSPVDMTAPLDSKSRILIVKHQGKIVASAAYAFPNEESERLDTERPFENGYPVSMPCKRDMIEISRLCTHIDYRKGDLLHRIFEHTYKIFATSGRKFIVTSCDNNLWLLYKKLGFNKTGASYAHPYLNGLEHHLILGPLDYPQKIKNINWIEWSHLFSRITSDLESKGLLKNSFLIKTKISIANLMLSIVISTVSIFKKNRK